MKAKDLVLKPLRSAYLTMALFKNISILLLIIIIPYLSLFFVFMGGGLNNNTGTLLFIIGLIGFIAMLSLVIANCFVAYSKEEYSFSTDRIIIKRGGIFSNSQTEMVYRNFTFVDMKLPFIENLLFHTGELTIRSSGSSLKTDIVLSSLVDVKAAYGLVKTNMLANGFNLNQEKNIYDTYPDTVGIVLNIFRKNSGLISFLFFTNIFLAAPLSASLGNILPVLIILPISLIIFGLAVLVRFLDLKRRHYQVFEGVVKYNKGFLTKHDAFIPVENISDSNSKQSILQTVFNVYEIEISSKGVGTEIYFKNLKNGKEVEAAVDTIVKQYQQRHSKLVESIKNVVTDNANQPGIKVLNVDEKRWNTTDFQTTLKMDAPGALIKFFLASIGIIFTLAIFVIPFFFGDVEAIATSLFYAVIFVIGLVSNLLNQFVKIFFTNYSVNENSIKEEFKFLTSSNKEFTVQKVTGLIIIRDIIDRVIGTCSVKFISIGSSQDITFQTIKYNPELLQALKAKFSFDEAESPLDTITSHFSFKNMLSANLSGYLLLLLIFGFINFIIGIISISTGVAEIFFISILISIATLLVLPVFSAIPQYVYGIFYHKRTVLQLYKDKFVLKKGLITLSESYARSGNIKNISATRYPFTKVGILQINIAGELIPEQKNNNQYANQQQNSNASLLNQGNKLIVEYAEEVFTLMDVAEEFLQHKVIGNNYDRQALIDRDQATVLLSAKSSMANGVVPFIILSVFMPFLWIGLPFVILAIHKRHYEVEQDRIVCYSGILNLNKTSILFARIDNLNIQENMWNKAFKTASILIETIGSIKPELTLENIPNHQELFNLLKEQYQKKA